MQWLKSTRLLSACKQYCSQIVLSHSSSVFRDGASACIPESHDIHSSLVLFCLKKRLVHWMEINDPTCCQFTLMGQEWAPVHFKAHRTSVCPSGCIPVWLPIHFNRDGDQLNTQCWFRSLESQRFMTILLYFKSRHFPEGGFFNKLSYKTATERRRLISRHCLLGPQK